MKINEFRFLTNSESFVDRSFINWSRCYEWGYVLENVRNNSYKKIHNTCCGPSAIHKQFHDSLIRLNNNVINSDLIPTNTNKEFSNFKIYDLTKPCDEKFDLVLCISTLEEIPSYENIKSAFYNLYNQLEEGGRLIITCDYPDVKIEYLEEILGQKCVDSERLNGSNSVYVQTEYKHLNVVLIDITK
jgi:hypothetical protein